MVFGNFVRIGIPALSKSKKNVKLPKGWPKLTQSVYNNEPNFAILTGKVNDIIVIDIDNKDPDFKGLEWFESHFGSIHKLDTLVTRTINNGFHVYFKYTDKLRSKLNTGNLHIDILSDKRCCYEGRGYTVVVERPIRDLTSEEIDYFLMDTSLPDSCAITMGNTISNQNAITYYNKVNRVLNQPNNTVWDITREDRGIKAVPNCNQCLLNPCREHSHSRHSALFINNDKTVIKTCFSCGSESLNKTNSKKIINVFNVIMNVCDVENTVYQQLIKDLLKISQESQYKRQKDTGIVYSKVKPYAYVRYKEPMDYLNEIFLDDPDFQSHVQNMDNLVKFMKQYDDSSFPFMTYSKYYIGFNNGILNVDTCEWIPEKNILDDIVVKKYIDQPFTGSLETPLIDQVLDYQFTPEVRDFIYACIGRLFGIRDNWGFMLYLLGEAGCGKSLLLDIVSACFDNVGAISDSYETKYGLSYLYDKDIVVCDDLPKDIHKIFPQQAFQTIITGGKISTAVKNGDALTIQWTTPLLFAGNWLPSYIDKGQVSRRLVVANFAKNVYNPDTTLKERILESELPAFIYRCLTAYKKLLASGHSKGIWQLCPHYFLEQQEELRMERNPLYKYLIENTRYKRGAVTKIEDIRTNFSEWLGKKVSKLDNGTFGQVNKEYVVEVFKICKHCEKEAAKGCCEKYKNSDRTRKTIVHNIDLCQ